VLSEFKPDIIHTGYVWQVGILAALRNFHPHLSMPWGSDILTEPDESFIKKKLVAKVMKQSDHIQCDADFVKQKIISDYGLPKEKITVFPWGIDLKLFKKEDKQSARSRLNIDSNKFVVIYNRHLEPVYGVNDLLEGFKEFAADKEDVLLLMLSEGSQRNTAVKFIAENKLEEKVNLVGRVVNSELPVFLSSADVYISTSLSDGSSLSLLEAMACGLGIIVTDVPAIKEWVGKDNGMIVKRKNPPEIANALNSYYSNRELINKHALANIEIAKERADWDKNYLKLKDIYKKLYDAK
jgi:glycosyltransferase involved in cell wall biosynthesis